jgi:pimeloyl-ACP methyl ester carboxylesterase
MKRLLSSVLLTIFTVIDAQAGTGSLSTGWLTVDGIELFYREGGRREATTIVFLHGNPGSSMQYAQVMHSLAATGEFHVLAPDYPSFGFSEAADRAKYPYTFDNLAETVRKFLDAKGVRRYALFMQDYGVPIGFRLISAAPAAVTAIIVQNGVIHLDGFPAAEDENGELRRHWRTRNAQIDRRRREYTNALPFPKSAGWEYPSRVAPEFVLLNMTSARRPGVIEARNDLWYDYRTNLEHYSAWQAQLRQMRCPVLVLWGSRDDFFTTPGAVAYLRDAPQAQVHLLDADHFATLEVPDEIARLTRELFEDAAPE